MIRRMCNSTKNIKTRWSCPIGQQCPRVLDQIGHYKNMAFLIEQLLLLSVLLLLSGLFSASETYMLNIVWIISLVQTPRNMKIENYK